MDIVPEDVKEENAKAVKKQMDMLALLGAEGLIGTRQLTKGQGHVITPAERAKKAAELRYEKKDKKRRKIAAKTRKKNRRR